MILGEEGCVIASITIDQEIRELVSDPVVISKGWLNPSTAHQFEAEIEQLLSKEINLFLSSKEKVRKKALSQKVRRVTGGFVNDETKRRPMIIPIVEII